ncbi:MAG: hypothetical protein TQ37_10490 [Candidatus Synechococcus spongiarum 15L]|uniref:Cysteinyl-tRNA synthetase n=1 Tax=Candidatus Synechococcus spongiarum 15L TaxID=1608419 RepID=A0A0G8ARK2_9SYNE|nr:MAG: hypothetical protein TQ37_10490 [Candidatus Synechococcus spongiarum 15L]
MTEIKEGDLTFSFPSGCQASKYEDWSFYRRQFQAVAGGSKTVDILCIESNTSWLIEIKDHRTHPRTKPSDISDEVANKVRDTLAGLAAAAKEANGEADQRKLAQKALTTSRRWRVVLHLEQPAIRSRLRPNPIDPANLLSKLRTKELKAIDAHPIVCDQNTIPDYIPWTVQ